MTRNSSATNPRIEMRAVSALRPYPMNARRHSKRQVRQIAESIRRFGFTNPVLVSDEGEIIAGYGLVEAAKVLGIGEVPTLVLWHLAAAERRAYVLADNKLALNAGWDAEILAIELQGLIDLDFDVSLTGFRWRKSILFSMPPMTVGGHPDGSGRRTGSRRCRKRRWRAAAISGRSANTS